MIAGPSAAGSVRRLPRAAVAAAALAGVALACLVAAALVAALAGVPLDSAGGSLGSGYPAGSSPLAQREIPPRMLALYQGAARHYGLDWAILAGIGKVECDHGRDPDPSCSRPGAVNRAGAGGPMQFLAGTWARYGVDANGDGVADRWDPADAIYSAANYLRASGAPQSYAQALLAYNHAGWYVREVQAWAARYRAAERVQPEGEGDAGAAALAAQTATPVRFIVGERALLAPGDGHLALIPARVPAVVQAMVIAGNELQLLPYGPGGHPDPRGALEEDCSSTLNYVLYRAGVRSIAEIVRENPLAQDYVRWGLPGPGRWVTVYATDRPTAHVFVVVAGLRLDTSHDGTDVGPNRYQDGPRWRILAGIPTWARWSVRHPPGL
jgi:hypothetical protein